MIHEYFVDPELIYKWAQCPRDAKKFFNEIGLGNPRLLSTFPRSKPSKLRGELIRNTPDNLGEVARQRLDVFIEEMTSHPVIRKVSDELPNNWKEAAILESNIACPDLIIAIENQESVPGWIKEDQIYIANSPYDLPDQLTPDRTKEALTASICNLLRYSNKIVLVDPYAFKKSGIASILSFIEAAQIDRLNDKPILFQVLFNADKADAKYFFSEIVDAVGTKNILLEVIAISEKENGEKFHNRYVLTELGGVDFGVGTDEGEVYQTDDLTLLSRERYEKRWNQYLDANAFEIIDHISNK